MAAGITAGGFLIPGWATAQTQPDPLPGSIHEGEIVDETNEDENNLRLNYETTQTSTGVSTLDDDTGTIVETETTIERETEISTQAAPAEATAAPPAPADTNIYVEDNDDDRYTGSGVGLEAGGGVNEFASGRLANITDTGGAWSARLTIGTRSPLAFEAAYIGSANPIQTLGLDRSTLMSNGAEGALKLHLALAELNDAGSVLLKPYLLAGFAWKHYDLRGDAVNTSNVADSDDVFEVPIGLGLAWNFGRFIADQRFDYRPALSGDIVDDLNDDNNDQGLQTWSLTARVGVEF